MTSISSVHMSPSSTCSRRKIVSVNNAVPEPLHQQRRQEERDGTEVVEC